VNRRFVGGDCVLVRRRLDYGAAGCVCVSMGRRSMDFCIKRVCLCVGVKVSMVVVQA
jgi:hypothetical protein